MKRFLQFLPVIIILFVLAVPALYINTIYGYVPLFVAAAAFALSFAAMNYIRRHISIESDFLKSECERGKSVSIGLKVVNSGLLLCPKVATKLFVSDLFGGEDAVTDAYLTLAPRESNSLSFDMDMPHIGVYQVGIQDMVLFDFFGFFRKTVSVGGTYEVYVKPRIHDFEHRNRQEVVRDEVTRESRKTLAGGTDYVGVRDYEMGDAMKQIHWKLSAHSLGYLTKLNESSREQSFSVIIDFAAVETKDRNTMMDINDALVETGLSLIEEISHQHTMYSLIYSDRKNQIKRITPHGRDDDLILMKDFAVIRSNPAPEFPDACRILVEESTFANRSTNVSVCTSLVTDELLQELLRVKRQGRIPELYQIVPAGYNSRELEACRARLRMLDEADIYYELIDTTETGGGLS